jgi:hypothetical protein
MTITTHKLLVLFFCVSTTTAMAMQSKEEINSKDMIKVLNKTAPIYKKNTTVQQPADISELLKLPREYSPRKIEKKNVLKRKEARNDKNHRLLHIK